MGLTLKYDGPFEVIEWMGELVCVQIYTQVYAVKQVI